MNDQPVTSMPGAMDEGRPRDVWRCPMCKRQNEDSTACPHCGHLRYWKSPGEAPEPVLDRSAAAEKGPPTADIGEVSSDEMVDWICPNCEYRIVGQSTCVMCGEARSGQIVKADSDSRSQLQRPRGLKFVAFLLLIEGVFYLVSADSLGPTSSPGKIDLLVAFAHVVAGIGAWWLRKWAMWLIILMFAALSLLSVVALLGMFLAPEAAPDMAAVANIVASLTIRGLVIGWLIINRELFDRHTWTDPDIIAEQLKSEF